MCSAYRPGASTGAVLVMLLGVGGGVLGVSLGAFLGAVLAFAVVSALSRQRRQYPHHPRRGGGFPAVQCPDRLYRRHRGQCRAGAQRDVLAARSLAGVRWPDVWLAAGVVLAGLLVCLACARALDAFAFGEDAAASLGVAVGNRCACCCWPSPA